MLKSARLFHIPRYLYFKRGPVIYDEIMALMVYDVQKLQPSQFSVESQVQPMILYHVKKQNITAQKLCSGKHASKMVGYMPFSQ